MSVATKAKRMKLVFGIAIPVLVLVTTIVMVSMSFAWFSQETTASIQSINLATQKAFVLDFESGNKEIDNLPYMGQTALDVNNGNKGWLYDVANPDANKNDAPYYFVSQLKISTQGETKDIELKLQNIKISKANTWLDIYDDSEENVQNAYDQNIDGNLVTEGITTPHLNADIALNFTWFFTEHTGDTDVTNGGAPHQAGTDDTRTMQPIVAPQSTTWYTPYGAFAFGEGRSLDTINGVDISEIDDVTTFLSSPQKIAGFEASEGAVFDFYIIFAPERIFWSQFFQDNHIDATRYSDEDLGKMLGKYCTKTSDGSVDKTNSFYRMYYSDEKYMESTFHFGAKLTVIDNAAPPSEMP